MEAKRNTPAEAVGIEQGAMDRLHNSINNLRSSLDMLRSDVNVIDDTMRGAQPTCDTNKAETKGVGLDDAIEQIYQLSSVLISVQEVTTRTRQYLGV